MARAETYRLGPFVGGINQGSDSSAVADQELVDCINFDLDIDGSLISRPPIVETAVDIALWTERIVIIGRAIFAGDSYLIGSNADGTYYFDGTTWTLIRAGLQSRVALQYHDRVWVVPIPGSAVAGGSWSPSAGWTDDVNMPEGESAVFYKTRMWIVPGVSATTNPSRLRFTDPVASTTLDWDPVNLVDVSPGDGEPLVDIIVYNDNLMLLKQDSTYILAYDISPSDALLREINGQIGVSTRRCVVQYENSVFIYHEGNVYEIVNYDFQRINLKVPFVYDSAAPGTRDEEVFLSLLGDRLIVRYYNRIYVYGLKTFTWTRWESDDETLHNFGPLMDFPSNPTQSVLTKYYAGSSIHLNENVVCIQDGFDEIAAETISCSIQTKTYDLNDPQHYKKLMWWGADVLTTQDSNGSVFALDRANANEIATVAEAEVGVERQFVKFPRTLRFRQIYFVLSLSSDGTTLQGPPRLFSLSAIVASKQTVSREVN